MIIWFTAIVSFCVGFTFGALLIREAREPKPPKLRVAKVEWVGDGDLLVTLVTGHQFRGQHTVWHRYPDGKRASTSLETALSDVHTAHLWKSLRGNKP